MEISEESPETYFLVGPKDYDMWGIQVASIDKKHDVTTKDKEIVITKEITNKEATVIEISEDEKATIYCDKNKVKKIVFNYITVEKTGSGRYSVKLNKKPSTQDTIVYSFAFVNSDGISPATIFLNKKGL